MSAVNQFEKIGYYNADVLGINAKTATATSNEIYTPGPGKHALALRVTIAAGSTGSITIKPQCSMQGGNSGYGDVYNGSSQVITGSLSTVGTQVIILEGISNWTKLVATVTGTITYTIEAEVIETPGYTAPKKWTYFVTAISAIVHNFPTSRSQVRVSNHNQDSSITLIINNNTLKSQILRPGSVVDLSRVSSISIQSVSSPGLVSIEILEHQQSQHLLTFGGNAKQVIAASGSVAYAAISTKLYKSTDGLVTWSASLIDITPDYFTAGVVKDNGTVIMWSNGGKIYRSTDGNTFTLIDTTALVTINPPLWHGMDYNGNTIVFGEYNTTTGNYRLIISTNDGLTWTSTLTKANPGEIRHWHSINYFPIEGYFLATSGDTAAQVTWWKSSDGTTWTQVPNITGTANGQDFRSLNFQYIGNGQIMWSSDATGQQVSIFKASLADPSGTKTKVTDLDHTSWGLMYKDGLYVVVTRVETGDGDNYALIYTSKDGINFNVEMKWPISQTQTNGGFGSIYYMDALKIWMFPVQNLAYSTPSIYTVTGM